MSDRAPTSESVFGAYERAWNAHDPAACAACFSEHGVREYRTGPIVRGPGEWHETVEGREQIAGDVRALVEALPDLRVAMLSESYGSDRRVWVEWRVTGTPRHAPDRPVDLVGVSIFTIGDAGIHRELIYAGAPPGRDVWAPAA